MKKVFILLFAGICLLACEKTIDMDIPVESPKMVLYGYLNPDSSIMVQLSKSVFVLEDIQRRQNVSGATVRVFEEDKMLGTMQEINNGWYRLADTYPEAGKTYRIEAEKEGMDKVTASEEVLQLVEVFDLSIDTLGLDESGFREVEVSFFIKDPPGENFYMSRGLYHARVKVVDPNDGTEHVHIYSYQFAQDVSDPAIESFCSYSCVSIMRDTYFENRQYKFRLRGTLPKFEDEVILEKENISIQLYNVSKSYYMYQATLQKYMESRYDPFAEPTRIFTNVEGGYGILGAISISQP